MIFTEENEMERINELNKEYTKCLCKAINQAHRRIAAKEKELQRLPGNLRVQPLGSFRLILMEVLMSFIDSEEAANLGREILNSIPNSTIQVLILWICELCNNNIFTNMLLKFFQTYINHSTDFNLCNSLIKTGALETLAVFYTDIIDEQKLDEISLYYQVKPVLEELIDRLSDKKLLHSKPDFARESVLYSKWRYALYRRQ